jgi:hypothetical protein
LKHRFWASPNRSADWGSTFGEFMINMSDTSTVTKLYIFEAQFGIN